MAVILTVTAPSSERWFQCNPTVLISVLILPRKYCAKRVDKNGNTGRPQKSPPGGCKKSGVSKTRVMMYQQASKAVLVFDHAGRFTAVLPSLR